MLKDWLKHFARIYMPVYKYESDNLSMIYAGYSLIKKSYYARFLLNQNSKHIFLGWYWHTKIPGLLYSKKFDFAVVELSRFTFDHFQDGNGYILPVWAEIEINIDRPQNEIFDKNRKVTHFKDIIRRIRKYNLSYEILTDNKSFDYFNERFYKPFMTKRHGNEAFIENLKIMWNNYENPMLMAIKEQGQIIGMSFFRISERILYLMRVGLLDGDEEYARHGVIGATYYFGVLEGQKTGCNYVDMGATRPFLTDTLTRYKMGLGAEFVMKLAPSGEYLWFGVNEKSLEAKKFLDINPFMYINKDFVLEKYGL